MVKEIRAFQAADGTIFANEGEALRSDAIAILTEITGNMPIAQSLVDNAHRAAKALNAVANFYPEEGSNG